MRKNGTGWKVWLMASMVLVLQACRPEPDNNLTLRATAAHAYDGQFVEGIELELERRVLENGILNGNYQWVGTSTTNAQGIATFEFNRVNALDYQLSLISEDWFYRSDFIQPDAFLTSPEVEYTMDVTPRGTVEIRLINANPFDDQDKVQFRTLNIPGEYATCSNAWESHLGTDVDVERNCDVEADRYLPYRYHVTRNGELTENLDSIWVPRGVVTSLLIAY